MPIRGSPNGARHLRPQAGRNRPEWVVAINRNAWSQSIGIAGRDHPVRALRTTSQGFGVWTHRLIKKWSTWMPKGGLRLTGVPVPPTHQ